MNWLIRLIFIILISFFSGYGQDVANYLSMRYGSVVIRYPPEEENRAMQVVAILKSEEGRICRFFGMKKELALQIYLPVSREAFVRIAGEGVPDWSAALFITSRNLIVMKRPEWVSSGFRLREELLHELTHACFYRYFSNRRLPLWFNEGLAQFLSGRRLQLPDGVRLSNALWARKIIPLRDVDSLMQFSAVRARLAYLESLSAVEFLNRRYLTTPQHWQGFLRRAKEEGMDAAMQQYLHMDSIDFEWRWFRWLQKEYRWFILFNLENLIWVAMILVLIGALYAIRYRNRKILKQWELQEQWEDLNSETSGEE